MIRFIKRLLIILIIPLFFGGLIYGLLYTERGLETAVWASKKWLPGELSINSVQGKIFSDLTLRGVRYKNDDVYFTADSIHLIWEPRALLGEQFRILLLAVQKAQLKLAEGDARKEANPSPQSTFSMQSFSWLPLISYRNIDINNFNVMKGEASLIKINNLKLMEENAGRYRIALSSSKGNVSGFYHLAFYPDLKWDATLTGEHIEPFVTAKEWPVNMNMALATQGEWTAQNHDVAVQLNKLNGKVNELPIEGHGLIHYHNGALMLSETHINLEKAKVLLNGAFDQKWDLKWELQVPDLSTVIPDGTGTITSNGTIKGAQYKPNIEGSINVERIGFSDYKIQQGSGKITTSLKDQEIMLNLGLSQVTLQNYLLPKVNVNLILAKPAQNLNASFKAFLNDANQINGKLIFPQFKGFSPLTKIEGNIGFDFSNLKSIVSIPNVEEMGGHLLGDVKLTGQLKNLEVYLDSTLKDGSFYLPSLRSKFSQINSHIRYQTHHPLSLNGTFYANPGTGSVEGTVDIEKQGYPATLKLIGEKIQLINNNEYKIVLSPDILLKSEHNNLSLTGSVFIPTATISPKDYSNVTTLPSEVVIVNQNKSAGTTPSWFNAMSLKLSIKLGDDVRLFYQNLRTQLKGEVLISQSPNRLAVGTGEFYTLEGRYKAYGRMLNIESGRLIYTGNVLTNPGLDINANQTFKRVSVAADEHKISDKPVYMGSDEIKVGVRVKGTVDTPNISFYSDPSGLSQVDILSYLVFGYPRSGINNTSSIALLNSLLSSKGKGKSPVGNITKKIQKFLGLSEVQIGSTEVFDPNKNKTSNETTINIGKKIGKKLSIHYTVGVFQPVSIFNLKYQINKRLAIQSETSSLDTGADILYEFERD